MLMEMIERHIIRKPIHVQAITNPSTCSAYTYLPVGLWSTSKTLSSDPSYEETEIMQYLSCDMIDQ